MLAEHVGGGGGGWEVSWLPGHMRGWLSVVDGWTAAMELGLGALLTRPRASADELSVVCYWSSIII